jgi:hypothetical protein
MKGGIIVCGDLHGEWGHLNKLINKKKPEIILQTGDFGWFPKMHETYGVSAYSYMEKRIKFNQYGIKNIHQDISSTKVYWCPGNHEDWWSIRDELDTMSGKVETQKDVFYMKRGEILTLPDSRNILFIGGAYSIDKHWRKIGWDWFPEETITQKDIENLPEVRIDIVVSHTCPLEFQDDLMTSDDGRCRQKFKDPSMLALSYVLEKYNPPLWYFSHFHFYKSGQTNGTAWTCLNKSPDTGWWEYLK